MSEDDIIRKLQEAASVVPSPQELKRATKKSENLTDEEKEDQRLLGALLRLINHVNSSAMEFRNHMLNEETKPTTSIYNKFYHDLQNLTNQLQYLEDISPEVHDALRRYAQYMYNYFYTKNQNPHWQGWTGDSVGLCGIFRQAIRRIGMDKRFSDSLKEDEERLTRTLGAHALMWDPASYMEEAEEAQADAEEGPQPAQEREGETTVDNEPRSTRRPAGLPGTVDPGTTPPRPEPTPGPGATTPQAGTSHGPAQDTNLQQYYNHLREINVLANKFATVYVPDAKILQEVLRKTRAQYILLQGAIKELRGGNIKHFDFIDEEGLKPIQNTALELADKFHRIIEMGSELWPGGWMSSMFGGDSAAKNNKTLKLLYTDIVNHFNEAEKLMPNTTEYQKYMESYKDLVENIELAVESNSEFIEYREELFKALTEVYEALSSQRLSKIITGEKSDITDKITEFRDKIGRFSIKTDGIGGLIETFENMGGTQ